MNDLITMLASLTQQDIYNLADSGAINSIMKGYALLAADYISQNRSYTEREAEALAEDMKEAIDYLLETATAEEAVDCLLHKRRKRKNDLRRNDSNAKRGRTEAAG